MTKLQHLQGDCANLQCPNKISEGQFTLVTFNTDSNVGDGSGMVQILLCTPCARALNKEKSND